MKTTEEILARFNAEIAELKKECDEATTWRDRAKRQYESDKRDRDYKAEYLSAQSEVTRIRVCIAERRNWVEWILETPPVKEGEPYGDCEKSHIECGGFRAEPLPFRACIHGSDWATCAACLVIPYTEEGER